ncbi:hypothetical protein, partial [Escherichia coli]|uniref:hypothetical protein n=1 Tax=Escherichia coli TaxID=562 RepID=UPI000A88E22F
MFKGQKTLAALAVSLLFTAPVYAADEGSGEIHFKGRCEQVPDMRSSYSSGAHPRGT